MQGAPLHFCQDTHYTDGRPGPHYDHPVENPLADIDRIKAITDPADRAREVGQVLNALPTIYAELRAMRQAAVLELRAQGLSFGQIGELLSLHRNRVQQIAEGRSAGGQGGGKASTE